MFTTDESNSLYPTMDARRIYAIAYDPIKENYLEDRGAYDDLPLWNFSSFMTNFSDISHNFSKLWNASGGLDFDLIAKFKTNRTLDDFTSTLIIMAYILLVLLASIGNCFVIVAVVRKPKMRTARNVFIINLAISDLLLCFATTPLTAVEILTQYWPLGNTPVLCKLFGALHATSIFVSTGSITAIAVDRCKVIMNPTRRAVGTRGAMSALPVIWILALLLALPQYSVRTLDHHEMGLPGLESIDFCYEKWPVVHGAALFSIFVLVVQFCLPLLTIVICYLKIVHNLNYRLAETSIRGSKSTNLKDHRSRKTNLLLMAIAVVFCLSWLPLNLYNIIVDYNNPFGDDRERMMLVYSQCHMCAMSSACSNPVLYGWLNDNFYKEFKEIFKLLTPCFHKRTEILNSPSTRLASVGAREEEMDRMVIYEDCANQLNATGELISLKETNKISESELSEEEEPAESYALTQYIYNNNGIPCCVNKNAIHTLV